MDCRFTRIEDLRVVTSVPKKGYTIQFYIVLSDNDVGIDIFHLSTFSLITRCLRPHCAWLSWEV